MINKIVISTLGVTVIAIVSFMVVGVNPDSNNDTGNGAEVKTENNGILATVYKSPTCGCCGVFASYMKKEGYNVETENIQDMSIIKKELGVPYELESCHTMEIGGYVVEGHIPEEAIAKLLSEKPEIKGIGMAGMPSGSPGMPGPKTEDFVIYEITNEGTKGDIFMTI